MGVEKDNVEIRNFLYNFFPEKANSIPFFTKVYGNNFAKKMIKKNVKRVISNHNKKYKLKNYQAFYVLGDNIIALCNNKDHVSELKNADLHTLFHESIHAVLERTKKECKNHRIQIGTGLLEQYDETTELGRGINEGYTEWLCEKAGFERTNSDYYFITDLVKIIEAAIGTEKVLELGKGNIQNKIASLLNMNKSEVIGFFAKSDAIIDCIYNKGKIENAIDDIPYLLENEELVDSLLNMDYITKDLRKKGINFKYDSTLSNEEKIKMQNILKYYLEKDLLPKYVKKENASIIECESMVLKKYFEKDLQNVFSKEEISFEDFEKVSKIVCLLHTNVENIPQYMKQDEMDYSSISIIRDYEEFVKRYARNMARKFNEGEVNISSFLKTSNSFIGFHSDIARKMKSIFENEISNNFSFELRKIFELMNSPTTKDVFRKMKDITAYKLVAKGLPKEQLLFCDKDFNIIEQKITREDDDFEFDFTIQKKDKNNVIEIATRNFEKFKDEVFSMIPDAKIHIINREIIIQNGEKVYFYYIGNDGRFFPMQIKEKKEFNFELGQLHNASEKSTDLVPSTNGFITKLKRIIYNLKGEIGSNSNDGLDENAGRIIFPKSSENIRDTIKIHDQDASIVADKEAQINKNIIKSDDYDR